jgi:transposase
LEGLKNRHRSGRPPEVSKETSTKIRKELSENQSGWMAKEVMNLIYERTGVKYHEVHIYRLLHRWGFSPKVPRMKLVTAASKQSKAKQSKRKTSLEKGKKDNLTYNSRLYRHSYG